MDMKPSDIKNIHTAQQFWGALTPLQRCGYFEDIHPLACGADWAELEGEERSEVNSVFLEHKRGV